MIGYNLILAKLNIVRIKKMAADFSMQAIISQQIQNLYRQVKSLSCSNTTEILKTGAMVDKMLMQYRDNVELLILQTHLEILNSREQRARAIASRVWELGGNISLVFEKMYLDDLINLGMLEMSMLLIKPHFENLEEDIEVFPLEMIKFALITGSIPLLKKIIAVAPAEPLYQALNQFADSYRLNNYEEHFKNIQRIVVETFGREICAYDYNIYTDRGFTDLEVLLYFSNYNMELKKYQTLLETKIDGYFLTSGVKRIYNLSFACRNIKDHRSSETSGSRIFCDRQIERKSLFATEKFSRSHKKGKAFCFPFFIFSFHVIFRTCPAFPPFLAGCFCRRSRRFRFSRPVQF